MVFPPSDDYFKTFEQAPKQPADAADANETVKQPVLRKVEKMEQGEPFDEVGGGLIIKSSPLNLKLRRPQNSVNMKLA